MRPGARRSARRAPSCRVALPERARQSTTGSPRRRASSQASSAAGSKPAPAAGPAQRDGHDAHTVGGDEPREDARAGVPERPRGRVRRHLRSHQAGHRQRAAELQRAHETRAAPSYASGAHAVANAAFAAGQARPPWPGSPQRRQTSAPSQRRSRMHDAHASALAISNGVWHTTQAGGATSAMRSRASRGTRRPARSAATSARHRHRCEGVTGGARHEVLAGPPVTGQDLIVHTL